MMDMKPYQKILVFGGSFDPPHVAHVQLPAMAMEAIEANAVAYVPAASQPLKQDVLQSPAEHRLAMLRLAVADVPHAVVLTDEIDRAKSGSQTKPSYTVDTLETLRDQFSEKISLRLLIGTDQMQVFDQWQSPDRVIELAEPLVILRAPQTPVSAMDMLPKGYDRHEWVQRLIELPPIELSSTEIRNRVASRESISDMVDPAVERYIHRHHLYEMPIP